MTFDGTPPSGWSARCLDTARWCAVGVVVCAPVTTALTSVFAGLLLLSLLLSGRPHRVLADALRHPIGAALAIFLLVAATGMLYGVAAPSARLNDYLSWRRLAYALPLLALFFEPQWKWRIVRAFVLIATVGLVASFLSKAGWVPTKQELVPGVLLQNHTTQGITFALALLCVLHWRQQATGWLPWALLLLAAGFIANIILITPARSGYLALMVVLVAWMWSIAGWRRALVGAVLVLAAMVAAYTASPTMRQRVDQAVTEVIEADRSPNLTSMGVRVVFYRTAWEMIQQRPLLGYGSGGFDVEYARIVSQRYQDWRATPSTDPHNIFLMILVAHGAVGLAAFGWFLFSAFRHAPRDLFGRIGTGSLLVIVATSAFTSTFRTFPEGHLIGVLLGVMMAARVNASSR